jgi:hypothetical protein
LKCFKKREREPGFEAQAQENNWSQGTAEGLRQQQIQERDFRPQVELGEVKAVTLWEQLGESRRLCRQGC